MLYDITMRGLNHLALSSGNRSLPGVVESLCNMRRRHQKLFHKLEKLRETVELESARLNSSTTNGRQTPTTATTPTSN